MVGPLQHQPVRFLHLLVDRQSGRSTTAIPNDLPTDGGPIRPCEDRQGFRFSVKIQEASAIAIAPEQRSRWSQRHNRRSASELRRNPQPANGGLPAMPQPEARSRRRHGNRNGIEDRPLAGVEASGRSVPDASAEPIMMGASALIHAVTLVEFRLLLGLSLLGHMGFSAILRVPGEVRRPFARRTSQLPGGKPTSPSSPRDKGSGRKIGRNFRVRLLSSSGAPALPKCQNVKSRQCGATGLILGRAQGNSGILAFWRVHTSSNDQSHVRVHAQAQRRLPIEAGWTTALSK